MHTSFTGSARKPRQVNLSGRNATNPWANLPGLGKTTQSGTGTQSAVAQAQADRVKRQQERDKITAVKKIQKSWRGHRSRKLQKQKWREEWDMEEARWVPSHDISSLVRTKPLDYSQEVYPSHDICLAQMKLLVRFMDVKQEADTQRLLMFGHALTATLKQTEVGPLDRAWMTALRTLASTISRQLVSLGALARYTSKQQDTIIQLLGLNTFITGIVPDEVGLDAYQHFHALQLLLAAEENDNVMLAAISGFAITILSHTTRASTSVFSSLVHAMLTKPQTRHASPLLGFLLQPTQQEQLSRAIVLYAELNTIESTTSTLDIESQLWLLSYLVYLRTKMMEMSGEDSKSFPIWLDTVSLLLSWCANDIATRSSEMDQPMESADAHHLPPLHPWVRQQISVLSQQQNVLHILDQLRRIEGSSESKSSMAKPLANYSIALLRAFPERAGNIRMWLYRGSPSISRHQSSSTIRYLWHASEQTAVFQKVSDHKNTISVLVEAAPDHNQIGRARVSAHDKTVWQEEWRIVLLFFELYTFILKLMDDEEFFSLDARDALRSSDAMPNSFQQGALPLDDIARMTTFLKNLAFTLYWHAAELDESNDVEEAGTLAALFGSTSVESSRSPEKKRPQTLTGNGVSQAYLKGLVTGLLRMLHERDSRRKFLPEGHWLMTSQFDMQGFISAVVAEEERRHERGDDNEDLDEQDTELSTEDGFNDTNEATLPSITTMFGFRPPHAPRTNTSRLASQILRRQEIAKRKRQSESLAPRLEILRNLPFFIPFDTRVQIFREFIHRDQLRRRNGWIDPDQWRLAVANSTQGRGADGFARGMDRINRHRGEISRTSVFQDAFDQFYDLGDELKEPIQISFIDQFGAAEAGIDGGGVTKEFLISVTSEAFDPHNSMGMFVENDQRYLYPNPNKFEALVMLLQKEGVDSGSREFKARMQGLVRQYEFLGRVVGKCLYEGILIDIVFAGFFLLKWALTGGTTSATNETAYRASINDLKDFDESLYQGLLKLKNYTGDVESDFSLNFTVTNEFQVAGRHGTMTKDLMPHGSKTAVTNANRLVYIDKITRYRLQQQPALVTNAFLKGLGQIIQPMWLAMFNQRELQKLVGGDNAELDIGDLRRNTQYGGLYVIGDDGMEHPTVALFWRVLQTMTDDDRRKVLKFVTSTPRAPLLGFSHLNPRFSIRDSSEDQTRLPSTSTCVNLLKLPRYGDEKTMREKLLYAIHSGAGFDLS